METVQVVIDKDRIAKLERLLEKKELELQQREVQVNALIDDSVDSEGRNWKTRYSDMLEKHKCELGNLKMGNDAMISTLARRDKEIDVLKSDNEILDKDATVAESDRSDASEKLDDAISEIDGLKINLRDVLCEADECREQLEGEKECLIEDFVKEFEDRIRDVVNGNDVFPKRQTAIPELLTVEQEIREKITGSVI